MNENRSEKSIIDAQVSLERINEIKKNLLQGIKPNLAFGLSTALLSGLITYSIAHIGDNFIWTIVTIVTVIVFIIMGLYYLYQCKLKGIIPLGIPITSTAKMLFIFHVVINILLIIAARKFLGEGLIWALYAATISNMVLSFVFSNYMPGYQWAKSGQTK